MAAASPEKVAYPSALLAAALAATEPQVVPACEISKSKFIAGTQCAKRLYLQVHHPCLATEVSTGVKQQGTSVGAVARQAFPGGVLVETPNYEFGKAVQETARVMADPKVTVIFEAAFLADGVRVRVDVLVRNEAGWCIGEVKSSTKVKDYHIDDISIQAYVLRKAGVNVVRSVVVHLNPRYVYRGGVHDLTKLFVVEPVSPRGDRWIKQELCEQFSLLSKPIPPSVKVGRQCTNPHQCEFREFCYYDLPIDDLAYLPISSSGKWDKIDSLRKQAKSILAVPLNDNFTPAERQRIKAAQVTLRTRQIVIQPGLSAALATAKTPLAFMDFEALAVAIPRFPGMKPWQPIPVQYSVHTLKGGAPLEHREFLADPCSGDPRVAFIDSLLRDIAEAQTIAVWSSYEKTILTKLAEAFPPYADRINGVIAKLWDMCRMFKDKVYHASFKGSFSIKAVLPALVPELGYGDLRIVGRTARGDSVLPAWDLMAKPSTAPEERQRIRAELLRYCERDTIAMYRLLVAVAQKIMRPA
jgi:CRISPR/Cas system-associated exonuclease Cas4 (RecB family)